MTQLFEPCVLRHTVISKQKEGSELRRYSVRGKQAPERVEFVEPEGAGDRSMERETVGVGKWEEFKRESQLKSRLENHFQRGESFSTG